MMQTYGQSLTGCPYCRASMMIKMLYYGPLKVNATIAITSHTKWYMICTYSYIFSSLKAQFSSPKTKWGMCSFLQSQMLEVCQNKRLKWRTHKQNQRQRINSTVEPVLNPRVRFNKKLQISKLNSGE